MSHVHAGGRRVLDFRGSLSRLGRIKRCSNVSCSEQSILVFLEVNISHLNDNSGQGLKRRNSKGLASSSTDDVPKSDLAGASE